MNIRVQDRISAHRRRRLCLHLHLQRAALALAILLLPAAQLAAAGSQEPADGAGVPGGGAGQQDATVVAVTSIIGDMAANVAGDSVAVHVLVGANQDPHVYEPSPADSMVVRSAALVLENGLDLQTWFDGLYDRANSAARRVVLADSIAYKLEWSQEPDDHDDHDDGDDDEHAHEHDDDHDDDSDHDDGHDGDGDDDHAHESDYDPHVWQSVPNAIAMVEAIRDAFVDAFPDDAEQYQNNAAAYIAELESLDAYIREQTARIPQDNRKLVTSHGAYNYFAHEYGYAIVGNALGSVSTSGRDPAAGEMAELVNIITDAAVPAVFAESVVNRSVVDTIAREAGVEVLYPLYSGAVDEPDTDAGTYIGMMRHNIDLIVEGLVD